jgi:hypothetical protein
MITITKKEREKRELRQIAGVHTSGLPVSARREKLGANRSSL